MAEKANGPGPAGEIPTERGLSKSQQLTLNAVRAYIDRHGIPPSLRDVMVVRQLASTSTIQAHFKHLQRAGAIELRDGVPRSVRVLWPRPIRVDVVLDVVPGQVGLDHMTHPHLDHNARRGVMTFRVAPAERQQLQALVAAQGTTLSELIRAACSRKASSLSDRASQQWEGPRLVPGAVHLIHAIPELPTARGLHSHRSLSAEEGDRKWAFAGGCWREWIPCGLGGDWLPSAPPPATARRFNYRAWVLGNVNEIRAAQGRPPVATC